MTPPLITTHFYVGGCPVPNSAIVIFFLIVFLDNKVCLCFFLAYQFAASNCPAVLNPHPRFTHSCPYCSSLSCLSCHLGADVPLLGSVREASLPQSLRGLRQSQAVCTEPAKVSVPSSRGLCSYILRKKPVQENDGMETQDCLSCVCVCVCLSEGGV